MYSRDTAPNTLRMEAILGSILGGPCLAYSSGLAAFHAMLVHLNPRRVAIGAGYHGCHGVLALLARLTGLRVVDLSAWPNVPGWFPTTPMYMVSLIQIVVGRIC